MIDRSQIRSLEFWRRQRPQLYHTVREQKLIGQTCPVCKGAFPFLNVRLPSGEVLPKMHCVCLCPEIEDNVRALVDGLSDVPKFVTAKPFSDLKPRGTRDEWAPVARTIRLLQEIVDKPYEHRWLTIWSGPGAGKSHMLLAARALMPHLCAYTFAGTLADRIHKSLDDHSLPELIERFVQVPVLIIDDLGTEHSGSEFANNQFTNIVNRRYMEGVHLPTVVATNLGRKSLNARYPRLASRILDEQLVDYVQIGLWDYRQHGLTRPSNEGKETPTLVKPKRNGAQDE
jgi:hypothetical protein